MGASEPTGIRGILAALFRRILSQIGMNGMRWSALMNDFLRDPRNGVPDNSRDQTSSRGNIMKEFAKDTMTFLVFCKGLRFLQAIRVDFIVRIHWKTKQITQHSTSLDLTGPETMGYFIDEVDCYDEDSDEPDDPKESKEQP